MLIQALFTQSAVEAINVSILQQFAGSNELQFYAVLIRPGVEHLADELRSVIHPNGVVPVIPDTASH